MEYDFMCNGFILDQDCIQMINEQADYLDMLD